MTYLSLSVSSVSEDSMLIKLEILHCFLPFIQSMFFVSMIMSLYKWLCFFSQTSASNTLFRLTKNIRSIVSPSLFIDVRITFTIVTSDGSLGNTLQIPEMSWKKLTT